MEGKKVLLVDTDPQGSLTISMGWQQPDELPTTLSTLMQKAMNDQPIQPGEGILHHAEGVDLIPANIELAGLEVALMNSMNREKMLKQVLDSAKRKYDFILLDCMPSPGWMGWSFMTFCIRVDSVVGSSSGCFQPMLMVNDPCGSVSTNRIFLPSIASPMPRFSQVVLFPTPPF